MTLTDEATMNATQDHHDSKGRFTTNNPGGPGNPFGGRVTKMRKMLLETMTDDDMQKLVDKLIEIALDGNLSAIKLVLAYTVGKPGAEVHYGPLMFDEPAPKTPEKESATGELPDVGDLTEGLDLSSPPEGTFASKSPHSSQRPPLANGIFSAASEVSVLTETDDKKVAAKPSSKEKRAKKRQ